MYTRGRPGSPRRPPLPGGSRMRVRDPSSGAAGSPRAGDNIPSPGTPFPVGLRPSVTVVLGVTVRMDTMGQSPSNNLRLGERSKDRYARTGTRLDEADVAQCQRPCGIPSIDSWTYTDGSMIPELCTSRAREVTAIKKIQKKWDFPRVVSEFDWGSGGGSAHSPDPTAHRISDPRRSPPTWCR